MFRLQPLYWRRKNLWLVSHRTRVVQSASTTSPGNGSQQDSIPDYRIEISEIDWELAPKKRIRTSAYSSQIPGPLLRVTEGKPVTIEIVNRLDHPEIVHWHGQWIPVDVDGSMEEGSPMIPPGARMPVDFTPRPSGLHWYHTHAMANRNLKHGLYTGQFGVLHVAAPLQSRKLRPGAIPSLARLGALLCSQ